MTKTVLTLADLPAGTHVYVANRKASGTVIAQITGNGDTGNFLGGKDAVQIDFGRDRSGYNFPEQCEIVEG